MVSFVTKDKIIEYFNNDEAVKRIKELESFIDNNKALNDKIDKLKDLQKKLVNSKEFNQINQYKIYLDEYNKLKEEILDYPFVEEYIECLEITNDKLKYLTSGIEEELKKITN